MLISLLGIKQNELNIHVSMLTELLYPLQYGYTPLHYAAEGGHTTCVENLLSTPGIDVNIKDRVSWFIEYCCISQCVVVPCDW